MEQHQRYNRILAGKLLMLSRWLGLRRSDWDEPEVLAMWRHVLGVRAARRSAVRLRHSTPPARLLMRCAGDAVPWLQRARRPTEDAAGVDDRRRWRERPAAV